MDLSTTDALSLDAIPRMNGLYCMPTTKLFDGTRTPFNVVRHTFEIVTPARVGFPADI